jgi:hypothetical protein
VSEQYLFFASLISSFFGAIETLIRLAAGKIAPYIPPRQRQMLH